MERKEFYEYPLRTCMTLHMCAVCGQQIIAGQEYFDGGYRRRCPKDCSPPNKPDSVDAKKLSEEEIIEAGIRFIGDTNFGGE